MTLIKAQAGVKNNVRRMNKSIIQNGSNHVLHVILFALFCFFVVYFLSKFSKRWGIEEAWMGISWICSWLRSACKCFGECRRASIPIFDKHAHIAVASSQTKISVL